MRIIVFLVAAIFVLVLFTIGPYCTSGRSEQMSVTQPGQTIRLMEPRRGGDLSVEQALWERRSQRTYATRALTLAEISQLLWAAQGFNHPRGLRTTPSAGALYPLEIYLVAGLVSGLDPGVYKYRPNGHELIKIRLGDQRSQLYRAALSQSPIQRAPITMVITAVYERVTTKYGDRGVRYVHIEVGHAAQNVSLQAVSLGLGTVPIGAFNDDEVKQILKSEKNERPLYLVPIGAN